MCLLATSPSVQGQAIPTILMRPSARLARVRDDEGVGPPYIACQADDSNDPLQIVGIV